MKILDVPTAKPWRKQATCTKCETRVELERGDVRVVDDQRDGAAVVYKCPTCGQDVWLNADILPRAYR